MRSMGHEEGTKKEMDGNSLPGRASTLRSGLSTDWQNPDGTGVSKEHPDAPSDHTIALELGGWNQALARISEDARLNSRRWTKRECLEAVRRFDEDCQRAGEKPQCVGYIEWHKEHNDSPSVPTIHKRLGSWKEAIVKAKAHTENERTR